MIDKTKNILSIVLVLFVIVAIIYGIVTLIISAFEKPKLITSNNMNEYMIKENLVTDYSIYYYVENCFKNIIEACMQDKYEELYNIYISKYMSSHSKEDVIDILENLVAKAKSSDIDYQLSYKLDKVYYVENSYLSEITIDENKLYVLFEQGLKGYTYTFAFIK